MPTTLRSGVAVTQRLEELAAAVLCVREAEDRAARQAAIVDRLEAAGQGWAAETALVVLHDMLRALEAPRERLRLLRSRVA